MGVGTHNYEATYYQLREQLRSFVRQPHMLPLEVLAECGIVGGIVFFGFLGTCVIAGLTQRFQRLNSEGKAQVGAIIAATIDPYLQQREAELALRIGDLPRAREAFRKATRLNPEHYVPYYLLAFFYQQSGDPERALPLYRKALALNPLEEELKQRVGQLEPGPTPATRQPVPVENRNDLSTLVRFVG